ncbi:hypothetical protein YC2023_071555 [Brassica napus]
MGRGETGGSCNGTVCTYVECHHKLAISARASCLNFRLDQASSMAASCRRVSRQVSHLSKKPRPVTSSNSAIISEFDLRHRYTRVLELLITKINICDLSAKALPSEAWLVHSSPTSRCYLLQSYRPRSSISQVRSWQLRDLYLGCLFLLHLKDELIVSKVARDIRSVTAHTISTRDFGSVIDLDLLDHYWGKMPISTPIISVVPNTTRTIDHANFDLNTFSRAK